MINAPFNKLDMVVKIYNNRRDLIEYLDEAGQTAVHYAAGINNTKTLEELLKCDSTAAYIQDKEGRTAAHVAVQQNNVRGLEAIMEYFPDSCQIADYKGRNIVHYSAFLVHVEALEYLLTDVQFCDLVNKRDDQGNTPLHLLASSLEYVPIATSSDLKRLIPKFKKLQLKTYNKKNHTPGDIANLIDIPKLEPPNQDVVRDFIEVAPKGMRAKQWIKPLEERNKVDIEAQRKETASRMLKTARTHMVVATLVATISFTAGLEVPGGFNQDTGDKVKGGTAMLRNKVAFRVFLVSDCIALACSLCAILCYYWIAIGNGRGSAKSLFFLAFNVCFFSIFALMVAFMAGTYSLFAPSNRMFAFIIIFILSVFMGVYFVFAIGVINLKLERNRLVRRKPPKLKN